MATSMCICKDFLMHRCSEGCQCIVIVIWDVYSSRALAFRLPNAILVHNTIVKPNHGNHSVVKDTNLFLQ